MYQNTQEKTDAVKNTFEISTLNKNPNYSFFSGEPCGHASDAVGAEITATILPDNGTDIYTQTAPISGDCIPWIIPFSFAKVRFFEAP